MSDLTDKLVDAVEKGQLKFGDVVNRLTPDEQKEFSASMEKFATNQGTVERNSPGFWPGVAGIGAGAGLAAAAIPAAMGGAGLASAIGSMLPAGATMAKYGKYGLGGYLANKLPEPFRTPAEMLLMMSGAGELGLGGAAASQAGNAAAESSIGKTILPDENPNLLRNGGKPVQPRQPGTGGSFDDILERTRGGGGISFENNGSPVRPNGPISMRQPSSQSDPSADPANLIREPGGSTRQPLDEADKRKIMFGGAGEGTDVKPSQKGPTRLRKPK